MIEDTCSRQSGGEHVAQCTAGHVAVRTSNVIVPSGRRLARSGRGSDERRAHRRRTTAGGVAQQLARFRLASTTAPRTETRTARTLTTTAAAAAAAVSSGADHWWLLCRRAEFDSSAFACAIAARIIAQRALFARSTALTRIK